MSGIQNSSSCPTIASSSCCSWSSMHLNMSWRPSISKHSPPFGKILSFADWIAHVGLSPSLCRLFCSNTFHILRPTKAPGFVYAWLELISHRIFIARMLAHTPQQKVCSINTPASWLRLEKQRCLTVCCCFKGLAHVCAAAH